VNVSLAHAESCQARNQARLGAQAGGDRPWGLKVAGSDRGFFEEGRGRGGRATSGIAGAVRYQIHVGSAIEPSGSV
jgi:hypothetical protein